MTATAITLVLLPGELRAGACISALSLNCITINDQADNNPPTTPTGETFTQLLGINNAGMIAGYYGSGMDPNHPNRGFTIPNGLSGGAPAFSHQNPGGSTQTQVFGITSSGTETVGFYQDAAGVQHGFVSPIPGSFATIDDSPGGVTPPVNQLLGVNDKNQAAGFYQDSAGLFHAYVVNNLTGAFSFMSVGPANSMAADINNSGIVTGFTFTNASDTAANGFLINGSKATILQFPGSTFTQAFGLNNTGEVVGDYMDATGVLNGFLYLISTCQYYSIDPNGATATTLNGINGQGDIVGFLWMAALAAMVSRTPMVCLSRLHPSPLPWASWEL